MDINVPVKFIIKGKMTVLSPEENAKLKEKEAQEKKDADQCQKSPQDS